MAIRLGDTSPADFRLGDSPAQKIYYGDVLAWERAAGAVTRWREDFSTQTTDAAPTGWTVLTSGLVLTVRDGITGADGKCLGVVASGSFLNRFATFDTPGSLSGDVDVLVRMNHAHTSMPAGHGRIMLHYANASNFYQHLQTSSISDTRKTVAGTETLVGRLSGSWAANTWYWVRFQRSGTALRHKQWAGLDTDEPLAWTSGTTEEHTGGMTGLFTNRNEGTIYFDYYAVGTGASMAPRPGEAL
jgi:hypothetical protein